MAGDSLIEAYLTQLRAQLPRSADRGEVLAEVEDHLRTVAEAHQRLGLSVADAERHAVGTFGSAELVARAFAQQKGAGVAMPTTITRAAGFAAIIGGLVFAVTMSLSLVTRVTAAGESSWFAPTAASGFVLIGLGLLGLHLRHRALYGLPGRVGRTLVPLGLVGMLASAAAWFGLGYFLSMAIALAGVVGIGIEVWRAQVLSRAPLVPLLAGVAAVIPVSFVGSGTAGTWSVGTVLTMAVVATIGASISWLGHGLWREQTLGNVGPRPGAFG